ncbi:MAG: copper chaperone PCu(A)C [Acetobacteraceae bacterium]|jgi:copper(I)-binding protein
MLAALAAAAPLIAPPVFAHSYLQNASPPVNSTVTLTPSEVTIAFTAAIEPRFSTIEVTGASAQRVDDGEPHLVDGDAKRLAIGLQPLSPGTYTVAWQATSVDTHKTDGSYHFTVAAADASDISLEHVWARASAGNATTAAAYLTVTDNGRSDRLIGASTPIADMAELHETINDNGVMKMRPVAAIALEPGKPVSFKPGGYHVMLMGLKNPLKAGDSFPLTLTFEHAQPVTVTAHVEAVGGAGMDHDHGTMQGMPGQMGNKP